MIRILLLVSLLISSCAAAQPINVIEKAMRSAVFVNWSDGTKSMVCTGMVVGLTRVLTAEHCLSKNGEDMFVNGVLARIVKQNESMGLLEIPTTDKPILQVEKKLQKVGSPVTVYGYAYGRELVVLRRSVAGYDEGHLLLDDVAAPGMSGGPILNEEGKIIGITQATSGVISIGCTAKEIEDFIR